MNMLTKQRGFTLVEVVLTLTILLVLAAFSAPVLQSYQNSNDLRAAAASTATVLRRAQLKARAVSNDDAWGVNLSQGTVTMYRGSDFGTRDISYDEVTTIPNSVLFSGLTDVTYTKYTGFPATTGTITFERTSGEQVTMTINQYGTLTYE